MLKKEKLEFLPAQSIYWNLARSKFSIGNFFWKALRRYKIKPQEVVFYFKFLLYDCLLVKPDWKFDKIIIFCKCICLGMFAVPEILFICMFNIKEIKHAKQIILEIFSDVSFTFTLQRSFIGLKQHEIRYCGEKSTLHKYMIIMIWSTSWDYWQW